MHITHAHSCTYTPTPTPLHTYPHSLPLHKSLLFQEVEVILQLLVLCLHFAQLLSVPCHRGSPAGLLLLHSAPELLQLGSRIESMIEEWTFLACLHSHRLSPHCRTATWIKQPQVECMIPIHTHTHVADVERPIVATSCFMLFMRSPVQLLSCLIKQNPILVHAYLIVPCITQVPFHAYLASETLYLLPLLLVWPVGGCFLEHVKQLAFFPEGKSAQGTCTCVFMHKRTHTQAPTCPKPTPTHKHPHTLHTHTPTHTQAPTHPTHPHPHTYTSTHTPYTLSHN